MFSSCNLHTGLDTLWGSAPTTNTASSAICLPFCTQKKALCVRAGLQPSTAVLPDAEQPTQVQTLTDYCHPNHKAALPWQPQPKFLTWRIHEALQPSTRPCKQSYPQLFNRKVIIDPHSERQWVQEATAYRAQAAHPMAAAEAERMQQSWEGRKRRLEEERPSYRCTWCLCCKGPGSACSLFEIFSCQITF